MDPARQAKLNGRSIGQDVMIGIMLDSAEDRNMPRLDGRIAFITGAGTGIGRATALLFAREGARVAIAEIDGKSGEETAHLAGIGAIAIRADVTDPESLERAIRTTVDKFGALHILHNNAGGATAADGTAVEAPLEEFWRAIKLDLYGTFLGCRLAFPRSRKRAAARSST